MTGFRANTYSEDGTGGHDGSDPALVLGAVREDIRQTLRTGWIDPTLDASAEGVVADHAYWVSGVRARAAGSMGSLDAVSHGFGTGDPAPSGTQRGAGAVTGGLIPALAYVSQYQTWGGVPAAPVSDVVDLNATNISSATIDPARADLDCNARLNIKTDGPVTIALAGCGRTVSSP